MLSQDSQIQLAINILALDIGGDDYDIVVDRNRINFERNGSHAAAKLVSGDNADALVLIMDAPRIPDTAASLEGFFPRLNKFASLSALTNDHHGPFVGAKILLPESFDVDHPFTRMMASAFAAGNAPFWADFAGEGRSDDALPSAWSQDDLAAAQVDLDGDGYLEQNVLNVLLPELDDIGPPQIQLRTDVPHPKLGGGLFCLLTMPYQIGNSSMRDQAANYLNSNALENPCDSPNLLGAWCAGRTASELCYTCFLPSRLHNARNTIKAVLLSLSTWATFAHLDLTSD